MNSSLPDANDATADHLHESDLFSIYGLNGENIYNIAKIVKIQPGAIHIFVYDKRFADRPGSAAVDAVLAALETVGAAQSRDMSYAISRKLFSLMRPVWVGSRPVQDLELNGYRQWFLRGDEHVLGTHISLDDEIECDHRVYAKIFMTFFAPTFIAFTFYMMAYNVIKLIPFAFLFGVIFGAIMVVLQWASIRRLKSDNLRVSASTIQFREIVMPVDFVTAFEHGIRSLTTIENCKPVAVDVHGGTIEAKVRRQVLEEGQEILMVFSVIDINRTNCIVWSESSKKGVTVDMGKNLGNVNAIISYLKSSITSKELFSVDLGDNSAAESEPGALEQ
jgi:hypothetical protein